jgi:hypothetical protein
MKQQPGKDMHAVGGATLVAENSEGIPSLSEPYSNRSDVL